MKKKFIIIIILAILFSIGVYYFVFNKYFKENLSDTSSQFPLPPLSKKNWQIYHRERFDYEIKYPAEWQQIGHTYKDDLVDEMILQSSVDSQTRPSIKLHVGLMEASEFEQHTKGVDSVNKISQAGVEWDVYHFPLTTEYGYSKGIGVVRRGILYFFTVLTDAKYQNGDFDKIFATFKFISPTLETTEESKAFDAVLSVTVGQLGKPLADGRIILENEGQIFIYDTKTMNALPLPIDIGALLGVAETRGKEYEKPRPTDFAVSNDDSYLFFKVAIDPFKKVPKIYAYNLVFNKIMTSIDNEEGYWFDGMSPDNKYVLLRFATCPCSAAIALVNIEQGKIIYATNGSHVVWSTDSSKFAYTKGEVNLGKALGADVETQSIYYTQIANDGPQEKLLIRATNRFSYDVKYWTDAYHLVYSMNTYSESIPEDGGISSKNYEHIYENPQITYWQIDVRTGQSEKLTSSYNEPVRQNYFKGYSKKIKRLSSFSPSGKWEVLVWGYWPDSVIYILDAEESRKIKISDGNEAIWIP